MKNILVPTDFSLAAENAFEFAVALAHKQHRGVTLLHVYRPPVEMTYPVLVPPLDEPEGLRNFFFGERLQKTNINGVPITYEISVGFIVDTLIGYSKEENIDFIVMGTQEEHSVLEGIFGSIVTDAVQGAFCPVLVVPDGAQFTDFDRILYATDANAAEEKPIQEVVQIAARFGAEVHFVNVNHNLDQAEAVIERLIHSIGQENTHAIAFHIATVDTGDRFSEAINAYAEQNKIDLVAMSTRHRGFFEGMFHRSSTKAFALETELPFMVIHLEDKPVV